MTTTPLRCPTCGSERVNRDEDDDDGTHEPRWICRCRDCDESWAESMTDDEVDERIESLNLAH